MVQARSGLASHTSGSIVGLVMVWMALAASPAWGQSGWPSYPNNGAISVTGSGNVGIGTTNPNATLSVNGSLNVPFGGSIYLGGQSSGVGALGPDITTGYNNTELILNTGTAGMQVNNQANNAALFDITNAGAVGIGTTSPGDTLDVNGGLHIQGDVFPTSGAGLEFGYGSPAGSTFIQSYSRTASSWLAGSIDAFTLSLNANSGGKVGIGTTSPQQLLDVAGTIAAREIIVSLTGADYVFDPGYRLAPLTEVADYIKENHHLPDVPSAEQMEQKGVSVGEMQAKLLAKVEELTLRMIQADERIERLERENRQLREGIQEKQ
jgi:hypothetical protein